MDQSVLVIFRSYFKKTILTIVDIQLFVYVCVTIIKQKWYFIVRFLLEQYI